MVAPALAFSYGVYGVKPYARYPCGQRSRLMLAPDPLQFDAAIWTIKYAYTPNIKPKKTTRNPLSEPILPLIARIGFGIMQLKKRIARGISLVRAIRLARSLWETESGNNASFPPASTVAAGFRNNSHPAQQMQINPSCSVLESVPYIVPAPIATLPPVIRFICWLLPYPCWGSCKQNWI